MSAPETTTAPAAVVEPVAVAPAATEPAATEPLATETKPEIASEAAAPVDSTKEEAGKDEVKIEATPITEGTLSYKGPGLLKFFSKKHVWLGSEPIAHDTLTKYIKEEKDEKIAHHNVAHASQTGEGLLFITKRAEDKTAPESIINLADATEVTRELGDRFNFKVNGKKHEFHAASRNDTDGWVVAIETAIQKAVAEKDTVTAGDNYKSTHSKLGKGAAVVGAGAATGAAAGAATTTDAVHDGTTPVEATATADKKERSASKGRSSSRKRASIFGGLMGKKDEKSVERANEKEAKKEAKEEEKHEKAAEKEEKTAEKQEEAHFHEERKAEEIAAAVLAAPAAAEEHKTAEPATTTDAPTVATDNTTPAVAEPATTTPTTKQSKRSSVFGFFGKKSGEVPTTKDTTAAPAVPAKDTAATTSTAPQLDPVDTTVPTEAAAVTETPAATAATTETGSAEPHQNPVAALEATPEAKAANKQKEGGDLFSFMKKKKAEVDEKKAVDSTEGVAAAEKTEGTAASPTEKRRSSFFNNLGGAKKERGTSPEGEKKSGLGGLFRKSSKSQKPTTGPVTDSSAPPAIPAAAETTEPAAVAEAPVAASTEAAPATEAVTKTELPSTTGTDALPVTGAEQTVAPTTTVA